MEDKNCDCQAWKISASQIFNAQTIVANKGIPYTGEFFKFCSWCGEPLNQEVAVNTKPCGYCEGATAIGLSRFCERCGRALLYH